jgi:3-oxoacyl-[acyl-carrier-protein] synthase II
MTGAGGATFAARHSVMGPVFHLSAGSVSAAAAIGEAFQKVAAGSVEVAVAGGAECPLHADVIDVFSAAGVLAPPDGGGKGPACRPFDVHRNGTLLGEGAGALVLESESHARRRGASPRAVLAGYGVACEAGSMTAPDPSGRGVVASVRQALQDVWPDEIGWIKTHGTGTRLNDAAEYRGLATLFGERLREIPLTSLKPMLGHCLGACGAVEAVAAILALGRGFIPKTLGLESVDPELPWCRVAGEVETSLAETIVLLFESFGGRCAALAVGRG